MPPVLPPAALRAYATASPRKLGPTLTLDQVSQPYGKSGWIFLNKLQAQLNPVYDPISSNKPLPLHPEGYRADPRRKLEGRVTQVRQGGIRETQACQGSGTSLRL